MNIIRPIHSDDLDQLEQLAIESGLGMTNLPADRALLETRIQTSMDSMAQEVAEPGEESYLFVLEDTASNRVVGTSGIIASVGRSRPFYSFKLLHLPHTSQEVYKYQPVSVLQMVNEYRGATEIATLFLSGDSRKDGNGRLLSRFRFLVMAEFPQRFDSLVMAEMRGVSDDQGRSVFWDNLGRHFLDMDFSKADFLSSLGKYQFIADLMPKSPIYICLLPSEARAVIGVTHPATQPALKLLQREGFAFEGCVDVFDAGPTIHCRREQIRTVRDSGRTLLGKVVEHIDAMDFIVCTTRLDGFRACKCPLLVDTHGELHITQEAAKALQVQPGEPLRYIRF